MDDRVPPMPQKPDFDAKPQSSPLWTMLTAMMVLGFLVLLAFFVTPLLWIGVAIAAIIGLQYLLWGWWFERIYRPRPPYDEA
jgi:ABC-type bacteriocin/lantibiotic exporter with double-glycine peptidase domain